MCGERLAELVELRIQLEPLCLSCHPACWPLHRSCHPACWPLHRSCHQLVAAASILPSACWPLHRSCHQLAELHRFSSSLLTAASILSSSLLTAASILSSSLLTAASIFPSSLTATASILPSSLLTAASILVPSLSIPPSILAWSRLASARISPRRASVSARSSLLLHQGNQLFWKISSQMEIVELCVDGRNSCSEYVDFHWTLSHGLFGDGRARFTSAHVSPDS